MTNWSYDCLIPVLEDVKKCDYCQVPCGHDWCPANEEE